MRVREVPMYSQGFWILPVFVVMFVIEDLHFTGLILCCVIYLMTTLRLYNVSHSLLIRYIREREREREGERERERER